MSTEQSETYTPCITLSDSLCDYTFKNVLRANESNVYNEHRLLTENNCKHINRKKEHTRIFNDDYKKRGLNEGKCKTIYQSSYLKGNLKTNITFDESIRDTMPTKTSQVKRYDVMKNYQSNTDNLKLNHSK